MEEKLSTFATRSMFTESMGQSIKVAVHVKLPVRNELEKLKVAAHTFTGGGEGGMEEGKEGPPQGLMEGGSFSFSPSHSPTPPPSNPLFQDKVRAKEIIEQSNAKTFNPDIASRFSSGGSAGAGGGAGAVPPEEAAPPRVEVKIK